MRAHIDTPTAFVPPERALSFREQIQAKLATSPLAFIFYAGLSAFSVYSCMYAFRKPFTSAGYEDIVFWGISYKVLLVLAQASGYLSSKFAGISIIGGLGKKHRPQAILFLILSSWLALFFFALVPPPYNLVFMFLNGFPLGLVWGVVFSYLEGRVTTEILGSILCTSFIFASGFAKFIGKALMTFLGIGEMWMPFATGALFVIPLLLCTFVLNSVPAPSSEDLRMRRPRPPMNKSERHTFLKFFGSALFPTVLAYMMLSIIRDVRDNFANEIWQENNFGETPAVFATSETIVSLVVLASVSFVFLIKNNYRAFASSHWLILGGFAMAGITSLLFMQGHLSTFAWMTLSGAALYIGYVPYNCLYFERMLATYQVKGNAGFVMYIADSFGYLAAMGVLVFKEFFSIQMGWTHFLGTLCILGSVLGMGLVIGSLTIFKALYLRERGIIPVSTPQPATANILQGTANV